MGESPTREGPDYATDFFIPPKTFLKVNLSCPNWVFPPQCGQKHIIFLIFFLCVLGTLSQVRGLHCSFKKKKTNKQKQKTNKQTNKNKTKNSFNLFFLKKTYLVLPPINHTPSVLMCSYEHRPKCIHVPLPHWRQAIKIMAYSLLRWKNLYLKFERKLPFNFVFVARFCTNKMLHVNLQRCPTYWTL